MDLENKLLISITSGFLNIILSTYIPALMKKNNKPLMKKVRNIFNSNRKFLITTSILISILVFAILSINEKLDMISSHYLSTNDENSSIFYSPHSYQLSSTSSTLVEANMFIPPGDNIPNFYDLPTINDNNNNDMSTLPIKQLNSSLNTSKMSKLYNNDSSTVQILDKLVNEFNNNSTNEFNNSTNGLNNNNSTNAFTSSVFPTTNTAAAPTTVANTLTNTAANATNTNAAPTTVANTLTNTAANATTAAAPTTVANTLTNTAAPTTNATNATTAAAPTTNATNTNTANKYRFRK
jgi:hypothetical protein